MPEFDVFLCHNSQDKPEVIEIARKLKQQKLKPWLDEWELQPGLPWQRELEKQITNIGAAAVFVGKSGLGPWQEMEIEAYLRRFVRQGCPVIPVLLIDAPKQPELPPFLEGMTWVDFRQSTPEPIEQLIWGITGVKSQAKPIQSKRPFLKVVRQIVLLGDKVSGLVLIFFAFLLYQRLIPVPPNILHASVNKNNEFSSYYNALKTVDSNLETYWSTKGGEILDVFMEFFFHEPKNVSGFKIYAPIEENNYAPPEKYTQPKIVELIFLNDSEQEITRKQIKLQTPSKQWEKHDFEQIDNVSKVKLEIKELTKKTAIYLTIHELEFY